MVNTSLYSGLSGLRAHQTYIDVIGSNLANVSTVGYRGSRVTFADLLSVTQSAGARPSGDFGGTNPRQLGLGVAIGSIDVNTRQGTFQDTGRGLDVALEGRGFFTLSDGSQSYYTRVGSFGVDADGQLVDLRNGFRVIGSNGTPINVPVTDTLPAQSTTQIDFAGSLPATVNGPLIETVRSENAFLEGRAATQIASLGGPTIDLSAFAGENLSISVNGQSPRQVLIDSGSVANIAAVTTSELTALFGGLSDVLDIQADTTGNTISFETIRLGESATLRFEEPATATGLLAALGLNAQQIAGTESAAEGSTDLAQLVSRQSAYQNGDGVRLTGTLPDGTPFASTFTYGVDGTTVQDLIDFGNGLIPGGEAELGLDSAGNLTFTSATAGEASLSLHIGDTGSPAQNIWPTFSVDQDGTGPDTALASIDIFDGLGRSHAVQLEFTRSESDPAVWNLRASLPEGGGAVISGDISQIRFSDDGSFNAIGGGTNQFTFRFDGVATDQTVGVNLGSAGGFDGISQIGDLTSVAAIEQDGFTSGTLLDVSFDGQGNLNGIYSNGQAQVIDQLRIAMFQNEGGLLRQADTLFISGPNSDDAIEVTAGTAGAGRVRAGSLENSNVDIAEEFVALIEAQRGFQANSRIITTTDEILAELVNIVN